MTFIAYAPVIHSEFINFDDGDYVFGNNHITSGLTLQNITWAFTKTHADNYHPLTSLSLMLDCELFGVNPHSFHLTNLLFHIANTLLLFLVLSRMTKNLWSGAFVAALFALHPLHVESVAWVSERKDVLSAFFWMLTLFAYIRYVEKPAVGRFLLTLLVFALGLLSKSMLVTLPLILFILDYWPLNRLNSKFSAIKAVFEKLPFIGLSIVFSVITFLVQWQVGLAKSLSSLSVELAYRKRACLIRRLYRKTVCADEPCNLLSTSARQCCSLANRIRRIVAGHHYIFGSLAIAPMSLFCGGVVMVFDYAYTRHWDSSGGLTGASRQIHLCSLYRPFHHNRLGRF